MALNIAGGDCDDSQIPAECDVPADTSFTLSVDIVKAPPEGYILAQTFVDFGDDLTYKPTDSTVDEFVWPDCVVAVRAQFDGTSPAPTDSKVNHGCLTGKVPPLPVSHYVGPLVGFLLTCSEDVSSTEVKLLRNSNPVASTSGAGFTIGGVLATQVKPLVNHLTVNCVAPVAVGGVALDSELAPLDALAGDEQRSSDWGYWIAGAAIALLGVVVVSTIVSRRLRSRS